MKAEFALKHIIFFDREFCLMSCNYISSWANNCQLFDANLHKNEVKDAYKLYVQHV